MISDVIALKGAREHNLKDIDLTLPHNEMVVLTGVSGSGKSTLAFDILFAEGQRRYLESLAPYVRQYMKILERPDVDLVSGLAPTVAIEQRVSHASRRSTVATLTEIYHFLRLLFSKLGTPHCTGCNRPLTAQSPQDILNQLNARYPKGAGFLSWHGELIYYAMEGTEQRYKVLRGGRFIEFPALAATATTNSPSQSLPRLVSGGGNVAADRPREPGRQIRRQPAQCRFHGA